MKTGQAPTVPKDQTNFWPRSEITHGTHELYSPGPPECLGLTCSGWQTVPVLSAGYFQARGRSDLEALVVGYTEVPLCSSLIQMALK